ncbi:hypothetical protein PVAND_004571 [Polypedilum vanderplanki]|uniref:Uncharacterized protein n=1 Tax=Polypedilum vanderplanki TaxID=319348 RepID=A0A9J6BXC9_POLVA|nr:hypothetical protein PVAND_004571 [Polypedilum vanderplanki]
MSFKLVILCAAVAVISCTTIRDQQDFDNNNNNNQQKQEQQSFDFNNQRNNQEQFNREHQFDNFNNENRQYYNQRQTPFNNGFRHFNNHQNPTFYHLQPAIISIPSSHRNFNVQDDSHYNFGYTISDVSTGDFKSHQETRQGDKVQGQFSLTDSDGFRRTVNYRADDKHGFDAEVRRDPTANFQQQQFVNTFENQQYNNQNFNNFNNENQNAAFFNPNQPKSTTTTQVSRVEDGQKTNYATQTTNF